MPTLRPQLGSAASICAIASSRAASNSFDAGAAVAFGSISDGGGEGVEEHPAATTSTPQMVRVIRVFYPIRAPPRGGFPVESAP